MYPSLFQFKIKPSGVFGVCNEQPGYGAMAMQEESARPRKSHGAHVGCEAGCSLSRQTAHSPHLKSPLPPQPWSRGKKCTGPSKPCPCLTHSCVGWADHAHMSTRTHIPCTGECRPACLSSPAPVAPPQLNLTTPGQEVKKKVNNFLMTVANVQQLLLHCTSCNRGIPVQSFPISLSFLPERIFPSAQVSEWKQEAWERWLG